MVADARHVVRRKRALTTCRRLSWENRGAAQWVTRVHAIGGYGGQPV